MQNAIPHSKNVRANNDPHPEERPVGRVSKDGPEGGTSTPADTGIAPAGPSFETPASPAPQDEGGGGRESGGGAGDRKTAGQSPAMVLALLLAGVSGGAAAALALAAGALL